MAKIYNHIYNNEERLSDEGSHIGFFFKNDELRYVAGSLDYLTDVSMRKEFKYEVVYAPNQAEFFVPRYVECVCCGKSKGDLTDN